MPETQLHFNTKHLTGNKFGSVVVGIIYKVLNEEKALKTLVVRRFI